MQIYNDKKITLSKEKDYINHIQNNKTITKTHYDYTENDIYTSQEHQMLFNNNHNNENPRIIYLFWTGGFDSTFRLVQLLLRKQYVQPIYIVCPQLDGMTVNRQNIPLELKSMKQIRNKFYQLHPNLQKYMLPTRYVTSLKLDANIAKKYIHITTKLFNFSRGVTQYERMVQYSYAHPYPIEMGLEKCGTGMDRLTKDYRIGDDYDTRVNLDNAPLEYIVFKNLRYPISNLTKYDMVKISKSNKTYQILELTWSCWYPKDNKPCGRCEMCKHRIIPH